MRHLIKWILGLPIWPKRSAASVRGFANSPPSVPSAAITEHEPDVQTPVGRDIVTLSPGAAKTIRDTMMQQEVIPAYLRVSVQRETETTLLYGMNFEHDIQPGDFLGTSAGIYILVDRQSARYLQGTTIDYQSSPRPGFLFDNPNPNPRIPPEGL